MNKYQNALDEISNDYIIGINSDLEAGTITMVEYDEKMELYRLLQELVDRTACEVIEDESSARNVQRNRMD